MADSLPHTMYVPFWYRINPELELADILQMKRYWIFNNIGSAKQIQKPDN